MSGYLIGYEHCTREGAPCLGWPRLRIAAMASVYYRAVIRARMLVEYDNKDVYCCTIATIDVLYTNGGRENVTGKIDMPQHGKLHYDTS